MEKQNKNIPVEKINKKVFRVQKSFAYSTYESKSKACCARDLLVNQVSRKNTKIVRSKIIYQSSTGNVIGLCREAKSVFWTLQRNFLYRALRGVLFVYLLDYCFLPVLYVPCLFLIKKTKLEIIKLKTKNLEYN